MERKRPVPRGTTHVREFEQPALPKGGREVLAAAWKLAGDGVLSPGAVTLLCAIVRHVGRQGRCVQTTENLARSCAVRSKSTIRARAAELEAVGLMLRVPLKTGHGRGAEQAPNGWLVLHDESVLARLGGAGFRHQLRIQKKQKGADRRAARAERLAEERRDAAEDAEREWVPAPGSRPLTRGLEELDDVLGFLDYRRAGGAWPPPGWSMPAAASSARASPLASFVAL